MIGIKQQHRKRHGRLQSVAYNDMRDRADSQLRASSTTTSAIFGSQLRLLLWNCCPVIGTSKHQHSLGSRCYTAHSLFQCRGNLNSATDSHECEPMGSNRWWAGDDSIGSSTDPSDLLHRKPVRGDCLGCLCRPYGPFHLAGLRLVTR